MKIFLAGHKGMVGSQCLKTLNAHGYTDIFTIGREDCDLTNQSQVRELFEKNKFDAVIVAAAKVGGIHANRSYPYQFINENSLIELNLIDASLQNGVDRLIFLGSSCIYPKFASQPIKEEELLTGALEPTNQWYALAKIMGIKLIEATRQQYGKNYVSLMPTNLYGPGDNFDLETAHVIPALIRKFDQAIKTNCNRVEIWGSGSPLREFMHVQDLCEAIVLFLEMDNIPNSIYNVGSSQEVTILQLAELIGKISGFQGEIYTNSDYPDGTPRKIVDSSRLNQIGWKSEIDLEVGLRSVIKWYKNEENIRQ